MLHCHELREQLVDTHRALSRLFEDLGDGQFEVFLRNMLPAFPKSIPARRVEVRDCSTDSKNKTHMPASVVTPFTSAPEH